MAHFYHNMIRKYVISFAHLFSDIHVVHDDKDETTTDKDIVVPIIYATKSKMFYEIRESTTGRNKAIVNIYVPRMGFNITAIQYDGTRKLNNSVDFKISETERLSYLGVPYNINFELSILAKKQDDLFQILEQIAVMFTPDKTITIKEITGIDRDVSLNLDTMNLSSIYEYTEDESRVISADLTFTLKGHFYPRIDVEENENEILKIINNYHVYPDELNTIIIEPDE